MAFLVYSYLPALPNGLPAFIDIKDDKMTFGRDKKNSVTLNSTIGKVNNISRNHLVITFNNNNDDNNYNNEADNNNEYFIEDLNTTNGTWINGVKIKDRIKLEHNDRIILGSLHSNVRYTFKMVSIMSDDNLQIYNYLKSFQNQVDIDTFKNHQLSKLFTPFIVYDIQENHTTNEEKEEQKEEQKEEKQQEEKQQEEQQEEEIEDKDNEIYDKRTLVEFKILDESDDEYNSISKGIIISYNKKTDSYTIQHCFNNKKKIQVERKYVRLPYQKKLQFPNVGIGCKVIVLGNNNLWYEGKVVEKRCNPNKRLKYEYKIKFIGSKNEVWCGGKNVLTH